MCLFIVFRRNEYAAEARTAAAIKWKQEELSEKQNYEIKMKWQ